jgi:CRP-like cAMP-binding protein
MNAQINLRQVPFFTELSEEQVQVLHQHAHEVSAGAGEYLFHRNDKLDHFYLVLDGLFEVIFETPKLQMAYRIQDQPSHIQYEPVVIATVGEGEVLGWSGLVPPHQATSCVRARGKAGLLAFDCQKLLEHFEQDCSFGFKVIHAAAQVIGNRIQAIYRRV